MFKKGQSGNVKGRPKGTGRKLIDAVAIMNDHNYCPITHAIKIILDEKTRSKQRTELIKMLADKYAPNLKAIEHSGDPDAPVLFNFNLPPPK